MAYENSISSSGTDSSIRPNIRRIDTADLKDALIKGFADFNAMPTHLFFLGLVYPIVTLIFARTYADLDVLPLVFPLLAGYTLIGPLIATGMYELSRRRELGIYTSRANAFEVFRSPSILATAVLGVVLMVIYFAWLLAAWGIYALNFGDTLVSSVSEFANLVLTTPAGWTLIVQGSSAGFLFAVVVLTLSVVSFPLLLDRNVSVMVAIKTSVRAVLANSVMIAIWGVVVAVALVLGSLPFFVGLAVVMPVLGHATWHLYRKIVEF
jgi:uncharacterized membrane protein